MDDEAREELRDCHATSICSTEIPKLSRKRNLNYLLSAASPHLSIDASNILLNVKFALATRVVHITNLPENGSLFPALVVHASDGPHASDESVWI